MRRLHITEQLGPCVDERVDRRLARASSHAVPPDMKCIGRELLQVGDSQTSARSGASADGVSSTDAMDVDSASGQVRERSIQDMACDGQPPASCPA